jgi:hypothetical protein
MQNKELKNEKQGFGINRSLLKCFRMNIYIRSGFELKKKNLFSVKLVTGNTKNCKVAHFYDFLLFCKLLICLYIPCC